MKIENIRTFAGPNVFSHQPTLLMRLNLEELNEKLTREISGFNERLLKRLPALHEHYCNRARPGGFVERLFEGTHFNHVIEHIVIELLALAGYDGRDKKTCNGDEENPSNAVVETTKVETTRYLLPVAAEFVESVLNEKPFLLRENIEEAKRIAAETELGPSARAIVEAAIERGIPWSRENEYSLVQLGYGKNLRLVQSAMSDGTSAIGVEMASDKDLTKQRLDKFSISVPRGEIVRTEQDAITALQIIGAPVVVKPLDGRQGKGVSLNLSEPEEVVSAFRAAREFTDEVLVEEQFEGNNYRVLVVGGKMVAASERVPCGVVGDGVHTIAQLIEIVNQNPLRGEGHEKPLTKIKIDGILLAAMQKAEWTLESVPTKGKQVSLCAGMNLSTGGTARDVTDEVHPSVKNLCERAARIMGMDICGVDLVVEDISAPLTKGGIIELNAAPGLRMHTHPTEGKGRDVGGAIIEMLYPRGKRARIPIISVTGTNGKTTVTRMIAHVLADKGLTVGMTTTDGIWIDSEEVVKGDTTGPVSAKTVLGDKAVEIAVLETARGGIVRRGLGYDWSDISVITNISEDHIGQDGIKSVEDLIRIKSLVAERVRAGGTLIINADDPNSLRVLERPLVKPHEKRIVYFSLKEENPIVRQHLATGGTAYFTGGNLIIEATGDKYKPIIGISQIPATMNGTAEYQIQNVLATIAACCSYGMLRERATWSLAHFRNETNNPGRSNLYRVGEGYVMVDYGHNAEAFAAVCRMGANWKNKFVTGIIGVPGDRDDSIIEQAGQVAARGFHRIIIKEDKDTRGRMRGEVAHLLCEAVTAASPERQCSIVIDEIEAFEQEIKKIKENEVVVVFYDKLAPVLAVLEKYRAIPVATIEDLTETSDAEEFAVDSVSV